MYIAPNSVIRVLQNCPLDNTYDHTIFFSSASDQSSYFIGLTKYAFSNQTYQRVQRNKMRVARKADDLYDCNYVMFQNTSYGTKWFYAFITSVEYINNETSEITFEIDVMQTWFFDYTLGECFVEREHAGTDEPGDNTIPENLLQGEFTENTAEVVDVGDSSPSIVFTTTFNDDADFTPFTGRIIDGVYCGANYISFADASSANDFLSRVTTANKIDGVINVYMCPWEASLSATVARDTLTIDRSYTAVDGYTPKNKKLLTYPYCVMHITSNSVSADFAYEFFSGAPTFFVYKSIVPEPTIVLVPVNYLTDVGLRMDQRLTITGFPLCSFNVDTYKAYLAYNANSLPVKMIGSYVSGVLSVGSAAFSGKGVLNETVSAARSIAEDLSAMADVKTRPNQANGSQTSAADFGVGACRVIVRRLTVRAEYAKVIDSYFTMYGYACKRVKTPNISVRPHWTYTKTIGCVLHGSVPSDDLKTIANIYNKGVTFWKNGSEIGDYSLDNSV